MGWKVSEEQLGLWMCVEWTCYGLKEIFFRCPPSFGQQAAVTSIPAVLKAKLILASL